MTARFTGKTALVTGGGTGIGRAVARSLAREGARVVVAGRSAPSLRETVALIEADGGVAAAVTADVTQAAEVEHLVRETVQRFDGLHVAVNNAGLFLPATPAADLAEEDWRRILDVNLTGVWLSLKYEVQHMRAHGGGTVVNIASRLGAHSRRRNLAAYVASKAAVSALTRNAALDHIGDGVRINAVSPGSTDTPMSTLPGEAPEAKAARMREQVPNGRVAGTEEIAAAVLYLASDDAASTVGADLVVDGGSTA
ncbi:glucose 1-dehydrogenase [Streptomyces sp. HSW2009]|uniref:SDR family NAD(P)-dependent oxidoreductase n=1 Tax=Streptomyces sp. HSW2009 TaxID=3142890 RepID=UPI0032EC7B21